MQTELGPEAATAHAAHAPPRVYRRCPLCAEEILALAVRCKHCGADVSRAARPPLPAKVTVGLVCFGLLTMVFFLITAITWLVMTERPHLLLMAIWRSLLSVGMVAVFVGGLRRASWGRDWMLGTAGLQAFALAAQSLAVKDHPNGEWLLGLFGVGFCAAFVAAVCLWGAREHFGADRSRDAGGELLTYRPTSRASILITVVLLVVSVAVDIASQAPPPPANNIPDWLKNATPPRQ